MAFNMVMVNSYSRTHGTDADGTFGSVYVDFEQNNSMLMVGIDDCQSPDPITSLDWVTWSEQLFGTTLVVGISIPQLHVSYSLLSPVVKLTKAEFIRAYFSTNCST